jgi:hypothetical protein
VGVQSKKRIKDKVPIADVKTARRPYMMIDAGSTALKAAFAPLGKVLVASAPKSVLPATKAVRPYRRATRRLPLGLIVAPSSLFNKTVVVLPIGTGGGEGEREEGEGEA